MPSSVADVSGLSCPSADTRRFALHDSNIILHYVVSESCTHQTSCSTATGAAAETAVVCGQAKAASERFRRRHGRAEGRRYWESYWQWRCSWCLFGVAGGVQRGQEEQWLRLNVRENMCQLSINPCEMSDRRCSGGRLKIERSNKYSLSWVEVGSWFSFPTIMAHIHRHIRTYAPSLAQG